MALSRGKLADIAYIAATTAASIYANPATTKSYIKGLMLFNSNTTAELVKLYNVPDAAAALGTAGVANQIAEFSLKDKETLLFPLNVDGQPTVLTDTNDSIQASTTTASKVTVVVLGDKDP